MIMNLIRRNHHHETWQPFDLLKDLQEDMNRLFSDTLLERMERGDGKSSTFAPQMDLHEEGNNYIVTADLPGIQKENVDVSFVDNILTIKGDRKGETEKKEKNYYHAERWMGTFQRALKFPVEIDPSKVKATFKDGVLELVVPKSEKAQPKQIKIDIK